MKINRFEQIMRSVRGQLPALFVFSFFSNILLLSTPVYMLQIFDRVLPSGSLDTLIWLSLMIIVAVIVYALMEQVRKKLLTRVGDWLEAELSPVVINRAMQARLRESHTQANLDDVSDIRSFIGGEAILAFLDAPWTPVFVAVIWLLHPLLGTIAVAGALLLFSVALLNDWATRGKHDWVIRSQRASAAAASDYVSNAETILPMGMAGGLITGWMNQRQHVRSESVALADTNARLFNLSRALRLMLQVAVLGTGAALVQFAELTPGGMIAASIILSRALNPIERSITAWRSFISYRKARARLAAMFRQIPDAIQALELPRPRGALVVEAAGFMPKGISAPVLRRVDFKLAPGEACGLIGPSGAGKSTLCKLLVGAYRPDFGTVRLDGADISGWDPEQMGPQIGYLPQEVELFPGTVAENIARMRGAKDAEIVEAAQLIGAHEMILGMPDGYESQVGLHGSNLSGGQRQRVGLARAVFGDPAFLVLDEPNSNLDGDGELALFRALTKLKEASCTIVIVAHQPNLLRVADKVLVLRDGLVSKFGPRDEVLKSLLKTSNGKQASPSSQTGESKSALGQVPRG
ncbi:type I secretion system permease/ATPase [Ruegeria arenilitoris]|uniref:type I secretion system permease/ATPase n=1 Tax=Ruegeria arenilitoris TaxID=1173585 RepID=UPI00147AC62A|nr:type I secretion system permease/ATPase [Ruegeria arenilitoris]